MKSDNKKGPFKGLTRIDALKCRPIKNTEIKEKRLESGNVILTYYISIRPWIAGLMRRLGRIDDQNYKKKLQLDELGTTVWDLMDGKRSVQQIIHKFAGIYRLHAKEAEVSVTQFVKTLGKRGLIGLK